MATLEIGNQYTITGSLATTSVTALDDEIVLGPGRLHRLNVEVANQGQVLTDFQVQTKEHPNGSWHTLLSGTDYATATSTLLYCSSTVPNTLASGSATNFHIDVRSAHAVRFRAQIGSSSTTVTVRCTVGVYGRGR